MMKKMFCIPLSLLLLLTMLTGCVSRVLTSEKAKERLESKGYDVWIELMDESILSEYDSSQVVILNAEKDGEFALQVYYFQSGSDTDRFFKDKEVSLKKDMEAFYKFRYSICRGTAEAMRDLLDS